MNWELICDCMLEEALGCASLVATDKCGASSRLFNDTSSELVLFLEAMRAWDMDIVAGKCFNSPGAGLPALPYFYFFRWPECTD